MGHEAALTGREAQILELLEQGLSNKVISRHLGIELATVKNHVHSVLAKLGVRRRAQVASLAHRRNGAAVVLTDESKLNPSVRIQRRRG